MLTTKLDKTRGQFSGAGRKAVEDYDLQGKGNSQAGPRVTKPLCTTWAQQAGARRDHGSPAEQPPEGSPAGKAPEKKELQDRGEYGLPWILETLPEG